MAKNLNPTTALREHEKATPHCARIATPPRTKSGNRERKRAAKGNGIGERIREGVGNGKASESAAKRRAS